MVKSECVQTMKKKTIFLVCYNKLSIKYQGQSSCETPNSRIRVQFHSGNQEVWKLHSALATKKFNHHLIHLINEDFSFNQVE